MTLINQNSSVTHNGNGVTTLWPYTFIIPDEASARVGLFDIPTGVLTELSDTDYSITGINDSNGGEVTYPLIGSPIAATKRLVIWREVEYTQDTELTNQTPYYPTVLEDQLDRIVMQIQQLLEEVNRSLKVTSGSDLDPDEFISDLLEAEANAAASAAAAAASAASASTQAMPDPAVALNYVRRNAGNTAYENRTPAQVRSDIGVAEPTRTVVTATGAGTYNLPAGCTAILVQLQAAGGGGGYAKPGAAQAAVGAGGGGGAFAEIFIQAPDASYAYNLGAPGVGGIASSSTPATSGTLSTFGSGPTILSVAAGALGAASASSTTLGASAAAGAGGTVTTGGNVNIAGGNGGRGIIFSSTICFGGNGGDSHMGTIVQGSVAPSAGAAGRGYGSGGSGGANVNSSEADGGAGAGPILIITEFYN